VVLKTGDGQEYEPSCDLMMFRGKIVAHE
jgi:hypothetical protein